MELLEKSKEEGNALSLYKICDRVLGTRSGYIKGLGYSPKPKGKGINSNAKIQKLEENLKEKDVEIDKLVDKVDYLTSRLENQERVLDDRLANQEKIWEAHFERQQKMFDMFLSTNGVIHQLIFLRKIW